MEQGFVIDKTHDSVQDTQKWVEGAPERTFWSGIQLKNKDIFVVQTYRCANCGYLESYATESAT